MLALELPVRLARYIAEQTHDLDAYTANAADMMLACGDPGKLTRRLAKRIVDEQRLYEDPDRAVAEEENALAARRVEVRPGANPATSEVIMDLDTADAEDFDQAVAAVAQALKDLGDTDDLDIRRARAVGILADPQAALADLAVHGITGPRLRRGWGTATTDLIKQWLTDWLGKDAQLKVQPFLDLNHPETITPVDGHDPTPAMVMFCRLRDPSCVFPGCKRPSRKCDLDHIVAYVPPDDGGPPGQTHPDNLAPLCRGHHRAKTHGRWHYGRLPNGGYRWTTPTGRTIDVPPARPR